MRRVVWLRYGGRRMFLRAVDNGCRRRIDWRRCRINGRRCRYRIPIVVRGRSDRLWIRRWRRWRWGLIRRGLILICRRRLVFSGRCKGSQPKCEQDLRMHVEIQAPIIESGQITKACSELRSECDVHVECCNERLEQ